MNSLVALLLLVVALALPCAAGDVVEATHIQNKDAPVMDGILEPIWKNAGQLRFPADAGNYYKFNKGDLLNLEGDVESGGFIYRRQKPFMVQGQRYEHTDPSSWTVQFLHDDVNLYVAVSTADDSFVESSDYDQTSDGFGMGLGTKDGKVQKYWLTWFRGKVNEDTDPEPSGPPLDRERMCYDAEWRSKLTGSWNNPADRDKGYTFEFYLPLETLGGYKAGDKIPANLIFIDHDKNPGGKFDDSKTCYMKAAWGSIEDAGELCVADAIALSAAAPAESTASGGADVQTTLVARSINPSMAPKVDGILDDAGWQSAYNICFPNPVGRTWTMSKSRYNQLDPSVYEVLLLNDGTYLYVGLRTNDGWIESSPLNEIDVDQESDGLASLVIGLPERAQTPERKELRLSTFWYQLDAWGSQLDQVLINSGHKPHGDHYRDIDHDGKKEELHFQDGPPRTPYALDNDSIAIQWASSPVGTNTWNNPKGEGKGYSFEYRVPLKALGDLKPGEKTRANIVIVDHDGNPKRRYLEFNTRYCSLWWGTDAKDLWEYDKSGKPVKQIPVPKEKQRFLQVDDAPAVGAPGYRGGASKYLSHFESASDFALSENGSKRSGSLARGYSGNAAHLKSSSGSPATFELTVPFSPLDLSRLAALQFVVRSDQETLPLQVTLTDSKRRTLVAAQRTLGGGDLANADFYWHKVSIPVEELKRQAGELNLKDITSVTITLPEAQEAAIDELAALSYEDVLAGAVDFIAESQVPATGLIRSFAGNKPAHTYDQAVALLALTDAGRQKEAKRLADAMIRLQSKSADGGFYYDSYSATDTRSGQGSDSGLGPNAWMGYALAVYGKKQNDAKALEAADRVCKWILAQREIFRKLPKQEKQGFGSWFEKLMFWDQPERDEDWEKDAASLFDSKTGGVWAGIVHDAEEGAPSRPEIQGHNRDRLLYWYSTEGVIDAQHLFELMCSLGYDYREQADKIRDWMFRGGDNSGWNDTGYFNLGHNDFSGNDTRVYLDTQTWGAMLAQLHGQQDKSGKALDKALEMISSRPFQGMTLRGFNDSRYPENDAIWFGGTAHYVAACNYLGTKEKASEFVSTLLKTQSLAGGWPHSSNHAYLTCFVRQSDGKVVLGYVDASTGMAYDDPAHLGEAGHLLKSAKFPSPEWTGYGTFHSARNAVGETAWIYFALKGYSGAKPLPYADFEKKN